MCGFILNMNINKIVKTTGCAIMLSLVPLNSASTQAQTNNEPDKFRHEICTSGTQTTSVLKNAPNPYIKIQGMEQIATIVIDLSKNVLYKYDTLGKPEKAYLIASGAKATPSKKCVQIVTHIETFPYKSAPRTTKRRRNPRAFGPKTICLNILDPITGEQKQTGQFIHGNNDINSLGKYASHGCIRMDNEVIKQLAKEVKRGDIVIVK